MYICACVCDIYIYIYHIISLHHMCALFEAVAKVGGPLDNETSYSSLPMRVIRCLLSFWIDLKCALVHCKGTRKILGEGTPWFQPEGDKQIRTPLRELQGCSSSYTDILPGNGNYG